MECSCGKSKVTNTIEVSQTSVLLDSKDYLIVAWLDHLLSVGFFFSPPLCVQPNLYYSPISCMKRTGEGINNKGSFI